VKVDTTVVHAAHSRAQADPSVPPISELRRVEIAAAVANSLVALGGRPVRTQSRIDIRAVKRVRDYLAVHAREQTSASTLEAIAGTDRFTIARHFRRSFGTSPGRYRLLRRLAMARSARCLRRGLHAAGGPHSPMRVQCGQ